MTGILESLLYFSDLRFTKSIICPWILAVAVSRCLLSSGLNLVTPKPEIFSYLFYEWALTILTKSSPFISSRAISMSWESLFMIWMRWKNYFISDPSACNSEDGFKAKLITISFEGIEDDLLIGSEVNVVFLFFHFYVIINKLKGSKHFFINLI